MDIIATTHPCFSILREFTNEECNIWFVNLFHFYLEFGIEVCLGYNLLKYSQLSIDRSGSDREIHIVI